MDTQNGHIWKLFFHTVILRAHRKYPKSALVNRYTQVGLIWGGYSQGAPNLSVSYAIAGSFPPDVEVLFIYFWDMTYQYVAIHSRTNMAIGKWRLIRSTIKEWTNYEQIATQKFNIDTKTANFKWSHQSPFPNHQFLGIHGIHSLVVLATRMPRIDILGGKNYLFSTRNGDSKVPVCCYVGVCPTGKVRRLFSLNGGFQAPVVCFLASPQHDRVSSRLSATKNSTAAKHG